MSEVNSNSEEVKVPPAAIESMREAEAAMEKAEVRAAPRKPKKERKPEAGIRYETIDTGDKKQLSRLKLAKDDSDPRWDSRMLLKLDKNFILDIAENGVEVDLDVTESPDFPKGHYMGGEFGINDGRMRVRAIPEANEIRKKKGLPPLQVGLKIRERESVAAMRTGVRLNEKRYDSDAVTRARTMSRYQDAGLTDDEIASDFGIKASDVHQHLSLLGLPPEVQKLVTDGKMSVSTAAGVARLDPSEVKRRANELIAAAAEGRVTAAKARSATGQSNGPDRLPAKAIKQLIDELKAALKEGGDGAAASHSMQGAVYALETVLDARKRQGLWNKLGAKSK